MSTPEQLFGATVRKLRTERGLTQEQLAERAHVHRTYLASIETGHRNVGIVNVVYLARALGTTPAALFSAFTDSIVGDFPPNTRNATRARRER